MKVNITAESKYNIGDIVSVEFAGWDFGEWDIERNLIVTKVDFDGKCFMYDVKQKHGFQSWKEIPEHQVRR